VGLVQGLFKSHDNSFLIQFEDLSLHRFDSQGQSKWTREEALGQAVHLEIIEPEYLHLEADLDYVKNYYQPQDFAHAPTLILERYRENLQYLVKQVTRLIQGSKDAIWLFQSDQFGFDKLAVLQTKANSLIAISTDKGSLLWKKWF